MNPKQEEIREKILLTAIDEFGKEGYQAASTNVIAAKAGVSKGTVFNYFTNKSNLYLQCLNYSIQMFYQYLNLDEIQSEKDIFQRLFKITAKKFLFFKDYPWVYRMMLNIYNDASKDGNEDNMDFITEATQKAFQILFYDVDTTPFREGIHKEKAMEYVLFVLQAFSDAIIRKMGVNNIGKILDHEGAILADLKYFTDFIRYGIYKKED